eukprot:3643486-Rhodomonas_salina.2
MMLYNRLHSCSFLLFCLVLSVNSGPKSGQARQHQLSFKLHSHRLLAAQMASSLRARYSMTSS